MMEQKINEQNIENNVVLYIEKRLQSNQYQVFFQNRHISIKYVFLFRLNLISVSLENHDETMNNFARKSGFRL